MMIESWFQFDGVHSILWPHHHHHLQPQMKKFPLEWVERWSWVGGAKDVAMAKWAEWKRRSLGRDREARTRDQKVRASGGLGIRSKKLFNPIGKNSSWTRLHWNSPATNNIQLFWSHYRSKSRIRLLIGWKLTQLNPPKCEYVYFIQLDDVRQVKRWICMRKWKDSFQRSQFKRIDLASLPLIRFPQRPSSSGHKEINNSHLLIREPN